MNHASLAMLLACASAAGASGTEHQTGAHAFPDGNRIIIMRHDDAAPKDPASKAVFIVIDGDGKASVRTLEPGAMRGAPSGDAGAFFFTPDDRLGGADDRRVRVQRLFSGRMQTGDGRERRALRGERRIGEFRFAPDSGRRGVREFRFAPDGDDAPVRGDNRPRLGVALEAGDGVLIVRSVMQGFPAQRVGIQEGDVIVRINGDSPATMERLRRALNSDEISLAIEREGARLTIVAKLDADDRPRRRPDRATGRDRAEREIIIRKKDGADALDADALRKMIQRHTEELREQLRDIEIDRDVVIHLRKGMEEMREAFRDAQKELRFNLRFQPDENFMKDIREALSDALSQTELDEQAREALEQALSHLEELDLDALREGAGRLRMLMAPEAPRAPAAGRDAERRRAEAEERRGRVERQRRAERESVQPPPQGRNRDIDARLNRLEERMERIERMLERLVQRG